MNETENKAITTTASWSTLFSNGNGIKAIALALGVMLHATNVYLATTVMPSIIKEIGGLEYYAWNTTLFVVASVIGSVVSTNRLAALGPRKAYQYAILIFALGSLLCTLAPNMFVLLAGRFVQGFGGGLLFALSYAMVRIVFEAKLWSRAMALISGMWGIAAFSGPFIGGIFAEINQWRWAFGVLLIICALIFVISTLILPKSHGKASVPELPYFKLSMLVLAALAVSIGSISDYLVFNITGLVLALLFLYVLIYKERTGGLRLLPTGAYSLKNGLGITYAIMTLLMTATAIEIYVPYFAQTIYGFSPLQSGYLTVLIAFGWTFSSLIFSGVTGKAVFRIIRLGALLMFLGLLGLTLVSTQAVAPMYIVINAVFLFMIGVGIGMGWPHLLTRVFALAPKGEEALAASSVTTVQLMATTFGAALAGLVSNMAGIKVPGGIEGATQASVFLYGIFALSPFIALLFLFLKREIIVETKDLN